MILRLFGYILAIIGLIIVGYSIITAMDYMGTLSSYASMAGYGYSSDVKLQGLISMALPGSILGLIILGIGLLIAKK